MELDTRKKHNSWKYRQKFGQSTGLVFDQEIPTTDILATIQSLSIIYRGLNYLDVVKRIFMGKSQLIPASQPSIIKIHLSQPELTILTGKFDGESFELISKQLGMKRDKVRNIEAKSLRKIRGFVKNKK